MAADAKWPTRDELLASVEAQRELAADIAIQSATGQLDSRQATAAVSALKELRALDSLRDLYERAGLGLSLLKEVLRRKGLTADEASAIVDRLHGASEDGGETEV